MPQETKLNRPWLVAVWPGMGHVALSAGFYLLSKLEMQQIAEFSPDGLFDIDHVEVSRGRVQPIRRPRSRLFAWRSPSGGRDIVIFLGEAQPPLGKYTFCESLIDLARDLQVERVFTFAAMATQMHPAHDSRVFAVATDDESFESLPRLELELLQEGHIGGLNGVLLGAAQAKNMPSVCLLGEMPHIFAQLPFPKASLAVLKVFLSMASLEVDLTELAEQATAVEQKLGEWFAKFEKTLEEHRRSAAEEDDAEEASEITPTGLSELEQKGIENLFWQAEQDRSKAYELKQELDRLEVFSEYEDRFLDLFKPNK